jgi:hypothetical protein
MNYMTNSKKKSSLSNENSIYGSAEKMTFSHKVLSGVRIL